MVTVQCGESQGRRSWRSSISLHVDSLLSLPVHDVFFSPGRGRGWHTTSTGSGPSPSVSQGQNQCSTQSKCPGPQLQKDPVQLAATPWQTSGVQGKGYPDSWAGRDVSWAAGCISISRAFLSKGPAACGSERRGLEGRGPRQSLVVAWAHTGFAGSVDTGVEILNLI